MATISTAKNPLDWTARGKDRVLQNARNLIALNIYDAAFARTMGIKPDVMDQAADDFAIDAKMEANRNFDTYMPELQVNGIDVVHDGQGMAQLEVDLTI